MKKTKTISCQDVIDHLCDYIDSNLNEAQYLALKAHIADCQNCQIVINTLNKTIELCKSGSDNIKLPDEVRKRLITKLGLEKLRDQ